MKKLINKHKGTGAYFDDGSYEFTPQGVGEPKYKTVSKLGSSYIAETAGTGTKSFVAHLKVDGDAPDPAEAMREQMEALIKKSCPGATAPPPKLNGRVLVKTNGIYAAVQPTKGLIRLSVDIDLHEGADYANKLVRALTLFNQELFKNHEYIVSVVKQLKTKTKNENEKT